MTGIALTVSQEWLRGAAYSFLAILHAITVIAGLLYLPFGKFFHIFQRPAQLGVKLYQMAGDSGPGAICPRCKERFASAMHIRDLKTVLPQLDFDYALPGTDIAWQDLCPPCKRKILSISQLKLKSAAQESYRWLNPRVRSNSFASSIGPHLNYTPEGGWSKESRTTPDRLVKTHCCFCGQQCGIQLKVRENHVIGFEPWEDFPFNHGMLCPKGVKRYLQSNHPDRLLDPLLRTDSRFREGELGGGHVASPRAACRKCRNATARTRSRFSAARLSPPRRPT